MGAFEFDVALSGAPEDGAYVAEVAHRLEARGVRVFFDRDRGAELWGRDLVVVFDEVFRRRARFVMIFVSEHYARGPWTTFQHLSAEARQLVEEDAYVLPVRLDDAELPGLRPTIGFQDARKVTEDGLVDLFVRKLGVPDGAAASAPPPPLRAADAVAACLPPGVAGAGSTRDVVELALGRAIRSYATRGARLVPARPLLDPDGFLAEPEVAAELAHALLRDREPDAGLVGRAWAAAAGEQPGWHDLTREAELLLRALAGELGGLDVQVPTSHLEELRDELQGLRDLGAAGYEDLLTRFAASPVGDEVTYWTQQVEQRTRGFVGRRFLFDAVRQFVEGHPCGYLFIRGDPGIGKTAFASQLVRTRGLVHHFNSLSGGITRPDAFLRNVCAQLIALHGLPYSALPAAATRDVGFLNRVLHEVSAKHGPAGRTVVVVDALDEVDMTAEPAGVNPLHLPEILPPGVFFVVTTRRNGGADARVECERHDILIGPRSEANLADVRALIGRHATRPGIQRSIWAQGIDDGRFTDLLEERSEGNFMYLHHVLPEIERGAYHDLDLATLPSGLESYYDDHWRRMRRRGGDAWFDHELPVVVALTLVAEPVSIEFLATLSGVRRARIQAVLDRWQGFLHVTEVAGPVGAQRRYQVYHRSFHEYLERKGEVAEERVDIPEARRRIAIELMREGFRDA